MAKFLVYIPSPMSGMPNLQIKVEAENWISALQIGRQKVGEKSDLGSNIMCDFKEDGSVEVTDPNTGRAFSIKEIEEQAAPATQPVPQAAPQPQVPPVQAAPQPQPAPVKMVEPATPPPAAPKAQAAPAPQPPAASPKPAAPAPAVTPKEEKKTPPVAPTIKMEPKAGEVVTQKPQKQAIQYQPVEKPKKAEGNIEEIKEVQESKQVGRRDTNLSANIESIMTSLFTEVFEVYNNANSREDAANFMLDLALKRVGAEAGSVLYADLSETELSFIATRGPKSEELKKFKVPIGKGIVGFCVDLGVSLAISDVSKDKRWFDKISKSIGFPTKSILCSPIQYEGQTIGAIELINKKGSNSFSVDDLSILNYIAHETAEAFIRIEGKAQKK